MAEHGKESERIIDVAQIDPKLRHTVILQLFEHLGAGHSLQIIVDHDPKRLKHQLEELHGSACEWSYLEEGPEVWRVRLRQTHLLRAISG